MPQYLKCRPNFCWRLNAKSSKRIDQPQVPKTLRPIFRDREDFSAGHSLNEQTVAALEASQFVIAICSPNAARSPYVDEEIRHFNPPRAGHGMRR